MPRTVALCQKRQKKNEAKKHGKKRGAYGQPIYLLLYDNGANDECVPSTVTSIPSCVQVGGVDTTNTDQY